MGNEHRVGQPFRAAAGFRPGDAGQEVGNRYRMEEGEIEVESVAPIGFPDITPALARESGFLGVVDLLKVAKHGKGENIYLVRFHYVRPTH